MMELRRSLTAEGIDIDSLSAFTPEMVRPEIDRLNEIVSDIEHIGGNSSRFTPVIEQLYASYQERVKENASALFHSIWNVEEEARRERAEAYIRAAEEVISQAKRIGKDTSRHELFLLGAREAFKKGNFDSACVLCEYPLRLKKQIQEGTEVLLVLTLGLLVLWLRRDGLAGTFMSGRHKARGAFGATYSTPDLSNIVPMEQWREAIGSPHGRTRHRT